MNDLIFTRLLYPYYDVIQSVYETFKTKSSYDESLFWMSEIYFSMFYDDAFFMIYFIYTTLCLQIGQVVLKLIFSRHFWWK